ncbi:hypothetical protein SEA_GIBBLES_81 [Gordonia phage Gibbles]|uniref:Uncharacterized protein n=3 Tax=Gordonia phage Orchid TaxID=1838075 RepID=A0A160DHE2_9CAUD|nr:hypothetical protein BH761_gp084 [Gordonia phage Orchid]ANA87319.1 hypothetical protein PBI_PATRICKSTAR_85 [Gordonia phage PatrickStar]ANA87545.1 hypothetical protein PBI_KAMPE_85 [Gordonia phage Kampe]AXH46533.1 hypothetical protein SEA_ROBINSPARKLES_85 [Gordonia phage RobinSparkles]QDK02040.1 hypothetical protein SEA_GIBBLES_81 [Gordonia phage Gibbles]ANA87430.1 hypothetical protein PBI_ORCHID_84 [Gordonia phage Orchid]
MKLKNCRPGTKVEVKTRAPSNNKGEIVRVEGDRVIIEYDWIDGMEWSFSPDELRKRYE